MRDLTSPLIDSFDDGERKVTRFQYRKSPIGSCRCKAPFALLFSNAVKVPAGFAFCEHEQGVPETFLRHSYEDIRRYSDVPRCGHFAAFQVQIPIIGISPIVADLEPSSYLSRAES